MSLRVLAWNTQGKNITGLKSLIAKCGYPEVVMVEEMGRMDSPFTLTIGTRSRGCKKYCGFALAHDAAENPRCTTAVMLREDCFAEAELYDAEALGYDPDSTVSHRPPVGVLVDGYTFVAVHAIANRHAAKAYNVELINNVNTVTGGAPWIIGGDFNMEPGVLRRSVESKDGDDEDPEFVPDETEFVPDETEFVPDETEFFDAEDEDDAEEILDCELTQTDEEECSEGDGAVRFTYTSEATQQSGGTLDYFVHNMEGAVTVRLAQTGLSGSDHLAVLAEFHDA